MVRKVRLSTRAALKLAERERTLGVKRDDEAARWLSEHDPKPEPAAPKSASKSKHLHRWRQRKH